MKIPLRTEVGNNWSSLIHYLSGISVVSVVSEIESLLLKLVVGICILMAYEKLDNFLTTRATIKESPWPYVEMFRNNSTKNNHRGFRPESVDEPKIS